MITNDLRFKDVSLGNTYVQLWQYNITLLIFCKSKSCQKQSQFCDSGTFSSQCLGSDGGCEQLGEWGQVLSSKYC